MILKSVFIISLVAVAIIGVMVPSVFAESFDECEERVRISNYTHEEYFKEFSSWASDNKDLLGKDVSYHVPNKGQIKADFSVSNVSLIPEGESYYILSFDTNVKLESSFRYPDKLLMDGRESLVVLGQPTSWMTQQKYFNTNQNILCSPTGFEFNSESGDTGTFHSCFGIDRELMGAGIYVDNPTYGHEPTPISVVSIEDIENIEEETTSVQQISWFDNIFNFFKSLFD